MKFKTTKLRNAISFALVTGSTALAGVGAAVAQESSSSATTLDRIEVTGSRIRQVDTDTAQPVTFITREDIERQGFQSVSDILQNITAAGTPPLSRAHPLGAGEAAGGVYISLRNLGASRTLVLLNGKRMGVTTGGLADISAIPAAAVERIEVLKDGASSIYGSDAIGGVVNVITRTNYEGAAGSVYFGQYSQGDGNITNGDIVMGFTGDRGSLTMAAEWRDEDPVVSTARPFSAFGRSDIHPNDNWTAAGQYGGFTPSWSQRALFPNVTFAPPTSTNANPTTRIVLRDGGDPRNPADYRNQNVSGTSPLDKSNTNEQTDLRTGLRSKGLYVDGVYDITDSVRFRTNLLYSNRNTDRTVAGYPMQAAAFAGMALSADSYFNPIGTPINTWWRRSWEVPRTSGTDMNQYRFSGAFEGSFDFADRIFDWDVSYLRNESKLLQTSYGNWNLARTAQAVGPSFLNSDGVVQCGTAASPIALSSCIPFNPFLHYGVEGQGSLGNPALQDFLFQTEHATGETTTTVLAANLAGSLFTLPAGDIGFAVGLENRKERGAFTPDALSVTGGSTNLAAGPTNGGYTVDEIYLEVNVPLLADVAFAKELTFSAATRYSDYDTFGDTTNNKFGLKWKPIDSVLVRATIADGFRAPTIADLYGGSSQTFSSFTDPCDTSHGSSATNATTRQNCINGVGGLGAMGALANSYRQLGQGFAEVGPNAQTPVAFNSGSNPTLTPETAESKTLGVVWSPGFASGLNVALDWWNIRIENTIVGDTPTTILNDCYVQGIASRCAAALFVRDSVRGYPIVSFGSRNAGYREVEGYDFDIAYSWSTESFGNFRVSSNSTYTTKDVLISTNDPRVPLSSVGITSTFRLRSNLNLSWDYGDFGVSWMARHYSSMQEPCTYGATATSNVDECNNIAYRPTGAFQADGVTPASALSRRNKVGSNTFNDLQVRWQAPWNATIAIGANNVFNRFGPVMYTAPSSSVSTPYYGGFDIGRFMYMKYTQRF